MKALLLLLCLSACATDRYLTKEEDAALRETCAPANDCRVLTGEQWKRILEFVASHRGTAI